MKWKETGTQFEKPPVGSHIAICYGLIDLGSQPHTFQNKVHLQRDVRISFELPTEKMEGTYDEKVKGKPFSVHVTTRQSLHAKANLRKLLEGWRGKKFDAESLEKFEPKKIVGLPCRVTLIESKDGQYVNVESVSPLSKKDKKPKQINPPLFFSLDPDEFDAKVLAKLSKKTQEKIMASPEYKAINGEGDSQEDAHEASDNDESESTEEGADEGQPF